MSTAKIIVGSALHELRSMPAGSVDLVVTSSPFQGLRSYLPADHPMKPYELGQGGTPMSFVGDLLEIVDECARVLTPHGSLIWELGDSMAGSGGAGGDYYNDDGQRAGQPKPPGAARLARQDPATSRRPAAPAMRSSSPQFRRGIVIPLTPGCGDGWPRGKSHAMIPEMLRMAMAYGEAPYSGRSCVQWIVRNTVRWCKPNPSVGDEGDKFRRATTDMVVGALNADRYWDPIGARGPSREGDGGTAPLYDWWDLPTGNFTGAHFATWPLELVQPVLAAMCPHRVCTVCGEPSRRIVKASADYAESRQPGDMFATLTGANDRSSGRNGAVGRGRLAAAEYEHVGWTWCGHGGTAHRMDLATKAEWRAAGKPRWPGVRVGASFVGYLAPGSSVTGGDPSSGRRGIVLDPFAGSGSTLAAAIGAGHDAIGIELLDDHADLAVNRVGPMFVTIEHGRGHLEVQPEPVP